MKKIKTSFIEILTKVSEKFARSVPLNIISSSFMMIMPIIMIGSISALFNGINIGGYQDWLSSSGIQFYTLLNTVYQFTVGFLGLYLVFCIGYQFSNKNGLNKHAVTVGIFSLVSFLIITPYTMANAETSAPASISFSWLGSSGMFMAIIIGFIVGSIFKFCLDNNIRIKLPDAVPPEVSNQFSVLIPGIITLALFALINFVFTMTPFGNAQEAVYSIVKIPLYYVSASVFGFYFLNVFMYLLWFFGIHGGMTVGPIMMMLFLPLQMENLTAFQAGHPLPHLIVGGQISVGTGSLALVVAILLVGKSKANRSIAKLAILPAFFGVDEPAYFGIPMVLNPIFFLPWVIINPALTVFGTYLLQVVKLVPYHNGTQVIGQTPFFLINLFTMGWQGFIAGIIFFIISVLIYIPFVNVYDKQSLAKELESENII